MYKFNEVMIRYLKKVKSIVSNVDENLYKK